MAESDVDRILDMFDRYVSLLERRDVGESITRDNVTKIFECCRFVEAAASRASRENKAEILESHLKYRWSRRKRTVVYTIGQFEKASDTMLEVLLKDPSVSTDAIDKLLQLYTDCFGGERLNDVLGAALGASLCTKAVLEGLTELGVSESELESQALLATWENEAARGNHDEVHRCIKEMMRDDKISTIVSFAAQTRDDGPLKKLIMKVLTAEAFDDRPHFYATLAVIDKKLLHKLLEDENFQKDFLDGVFYFGRNMEMRNGGWQSDHEFTYDLLVRTMRMLLRGPDVVSKMTRYLLDHVESQPESSTIWNDVCRDSSR